MTTQLGRQKKLAAIAKPSEIGFVITYLKPEAADYRRRFVRSLAKVREITSDTFYIGETLRFGACERGLWGLKWCV